MNNVSVKLVTRLLCAHMFSVLSILLGIYLEGELLGHVKTLCLTL